GAGENIEVPGYAPFPTQDEADIVFFQLNDTRTFTDLMKYSTKEANIDAHEIILLSSAPSKSDRQKIEGYLAHKWGIAHKLPSTHPYKFSASGIDSFVNYIYNSGIIINDGGNINDWTALANSSLSTDNSYYKLAKSGVKVASTAGGARSAVEFNLDGYDMSKLNTIIIDFYTPDSQKFGGNCQVYLSSTANYSKYHRCGHGFSANYWTGYNRITCGRSMFSNDSTGEVWGDAKQRLKIEFDSLSGQLPEFTICGVRCNFLSVPKILVQIDDGRIGDYNLARPILNNLGIKCTFGIVSDNVGTEGHMTLAQLETLASEGHLIANHSKAHTNMFGVTDHELLRTYIGDCQTYLRNNGFIVGADYLIYPNGGYNDDVIQVCQELGIKQARSTRAGYNYYPIEYPYILKNIMPTRGTTVSYLKARVDQCISECNRLDLTYHELVADPGSTYTHDPNDFEEVMEYIAETEVQCVTYDEFYDNDAHVWQSP
ncbi:MAG: polysaccharide deacetylase family protein, partial [bacterium]